MLVKNQNIVLRTVHGSIFLIDISDNYAGDKCALYEMSIPGDFTPRFWKMETGIPE